MYVQSLDQKTVKKSRLRLVLSGNVFELYQYETCYLYNWPPDKRGEAQRAAEPQKRRSDNLRAAQQRIRRLIEANKDLSGERVKFVTYTFADNITDVASANALWSAHIRALNIRFDRKLRYLCAVEFQERGAVHYHVLFFNMPFVRELKKILAEQWGHGFIKVKAIGKVKNIGLYMSKYMVKAVSDKRLSGKKAYFGSRNLERPVVYRDEQTCAELLAGLVERGLLESKQVYRSLRSGAVTKHTYACNDYLAC